MQHAGSIVPNYMVLWCIVRPFYLICSSFMISWKICLRPGSNKPELTRAKWCDELTRFCISHLRQLQSQARGPWQISVIRGIGKKRWLPMIGPLWFINVLMSWGLESSWRYEARDSWCLTWHWVLQCWPGIHPGQFWLLYKNNAPSSFKSSGIVDGPGLMTSLRSTWDFHLLSGQNEPKARPWPQKCPKKWHFKKELLWATGCLHFWHLHAKQRVAHKISD